jgi:hypothetical protein
MALVRRYLCCRSGGYRVCGVADGANEVKHDFLRYHRQCKACKQVRPIKGGTMKGDGKGMARKFYCLECK